MISNPRNTVAPMTGISAVQIRQCKVTDTGRGGELVSRAQDKVFF